jgi:hypothetical protein
MKKKDIIKLVKESIQEVRGHYGQHDYYGNNVGGRNSISDMPGVWEQDMMEGAFGMSAEDLAATYSLEKLQSIRDEIMGDMEQEAEPEGGRIADMYADQLQGIDDAIAIKQGNSIEGGPSYDEVYLKGKLVGIKDAYEYDKEKGRITIYPDLGSLQWKSRSSQYISFTKERGEIHFVHAFGYERTYDELKKVLPELPPMGNSSYSGMMNTSADHVYGTGMTVDLDTAKAMIQAMNKGRSAEAGAQSAFYTRQPGTGGTGIDEQAPPGGPPPSGGGAPPPERGASKEPIDPDAQAEKKEIDDLEKEKFNVKIKYLNKKKAKASANAAKQSSQAMKQIQTQIQQMLQQRAKVGTQQPQQPQKENKIMKNKHYLNYIKENINNNLIENMNEHRKQAKRQMLMEGALKQFFEMFDMGRTDEEIVQDYASKGVSVPEQFVGKARKQYESLTKLKTELEMSEKEFKNSAENIVNNPATNEMDGTVTDGDKQLSSGLFGN